MRAILDNGSSLRMANPRNQTQSNWGFELPAQNNSAQEKSNNSHSTAKNEQQADAVADNVMRMKQGESLQMRPMSKEGSVHSKIRMKPEREEDILQMNLVSQSDSGQTSPDISTKINRTHGSGSAMNAGTLSTMQNRFGADFSGVRIHTGQQATELNQQLNAQAFTVGSNIFFNRGNYTPTTQAGGHLLAHELTHVLQQGASNRPMVQKSGKTTPKSDDKKSNHLVNLVAGLLQDQLSNTGMKSHLGSLGKKLKALALENSKSEGSKPMAGIERLAALNIPGAIEFSAKAILNDKGFKSFKNRIIGFARGSDEAALITLLAAAIAVVLADIPVKHKLSKKLGKGISTGGSFDLGTIRSLQFTELTAYLQYANSYFQSKISGKINKSKDTGDFSGVGKGEIKLGNKQSNLLGGLSINTEGEVTVFGKLTAGYTFGDSSKLNFTTKLSRSFVSDETIITPGMSGKFMLDSGQSIKLGTEFKISSDSGLKGVTGYIEYKSDQLIFRIEGSMTGLGEDVGIAPGGDMRVQAMLIIPLF